MPLNQSFSSVPSCEKLHAHTVVPIYHCINVSRRTEQSYSTCRYGQQGKGPGEEWSYGSKKGTNGGKVKERDGTDYPAPVLAYYPPGIHISIYAHKEISLFTDR